MGIVANTANTPSPCATANRLTIRDIPSYQLVNEPYNSSIRALSQNESLNRQPDHPNHSAGFTPMSFRRVRHPRTVNHSSSSTPCTAFAPSVRKFRAVCAV